MHKFQPRRLTVDVTNPGYDRRRNYGIDAHKTIEAGTFFMHRPDVIFQKEGQEYPTCWAEEGRVLLWGTKTEYTGSKLAALMFTSSTPCEPATAAEVMLSRDVGSHNGDDVLQKMVEMGVITLDQIGAACDAFNKQLEE